MKKERCLDCCHCCGITVIDDKDRRRLLRDEEGRLVEFCRTCGRLLRREEE